MGTGVGDQSDEEDAAEDSNAGAQFSSEWLEAVSHSASALLLACILKLGHISDGGVRQLAVDVGYLKNVMSAVGVTAGPLFVRSLELLEMDTPELSAIIQANAKGPTRDAILMLERSLGAARGVGVDIVC